MRKLKSVLVLLTAILFSCAISLEAQTFHKELHATLDNEYVACLNKQLSGTWTYHVAYHVDKKTGMLTNVHWNILQSDLWDSEGNKYKCLDTGNETLGSELFSLWDILNNINAYNEGYNVWYDVEDGWLPVPEVRPEEGHLVSAVFRFMGNGEKVTWTTLWHIHMNSKGEIKAEIYKEKIDCN